MLERGDADQRGVAQNDVGPECLSRHLRLGRRSRTMDDLDRDAAYSGRHVGFDLEAGE